MKRLAYKDYSPAAWRLRLACGFRVHRPQITVDTADVLALLDELNYPPPPVDVEPDTDDLV